MEYRFAVNVAGYRKGETATSDEILAKGINPVGLYDRGFVVFAKQPEVVLPSEDIYNVKDGSNDGTEQGWDGDPNGEPEDPDFGEPEPWELEALEEEVDGDFYNSF